MVSYMRILYIIIRVLIFSDRIKTQQVLRGFRIPRWTAGVERLELPRVQNGVQGAQDSSEVALSDLCGYLVVVVEVTYQAHVASHGDFLEALLLLDLDLLMDEHGRKPRGADCSASPYIRQTTCIVTFGNVLLE
jgi:hypothetical protein